VWLVVPLSSWLSLQRVTTMADLDCSTNQGNWATDVEPVKPEPKIKMPLWKFFLFATFSLVAGLIAGGYLATLK
jgi:hypothetical protein